MRGRGTDLLSAAVLGGSQKSVVLVEGLWKGSP